MIPSAEFFRAYLAAWESHDVERVMAFFTPEIDFGDMTLGHRAMGTDRMRVFVAASFAHVPDARYRYVAHVATTTDYALEWVMYPDGTDSPGVAGASVGRLRDGLIDRHRDFWNDARVGGTGRSPSS